MEALGYIAPLPAGKAMSTGDLGICIASRVLTVHGLPDGSHHMREQH